MFENVVDEGDIWDKGTNILEDNLVDEGITV